jgi:hypothetical protein
MGFLESLAVAVIMIGVVGLLGMLAYWISHR